MKFKHGFTIVLLIVLALMLSTGFRLANAAPVEQGNDIRPGTSAEADCVENGINTCANPIPIACGDTYNGDTSGGSFNIGMYSCTPWDETGPEDIFRLSLDPGSIYTVTAELSNIVVDLDVFILDPAGCSAGVCLTPNSYDDAAAEASSLPAGDYYIAVDGFAGNAGFYTLDVTCDATPLNQPPNVPAPLAPKDAAIGVELNHTLMWTGGDPDGDKVTYDVYFDIGVAPPTTLVGNDLSDTAYSPGTMQPNTTYAWQVVAMDDQGAITIGPVWTFTTGSTPGMMQPYLVKDIHLGINSSWPFQLIPRMDTVFFLAQDAAHGGELWKSDGTAAGTVMVKDINPGKADSNPHTFTDFGYYTYFVADDGVHGDELWKTDGTAAGTVLVKDINPGAARSGIHWLIVSNAMLYISADDGTHGGELWKSDGTAAGTVLVKDINPGADGSWPISFFETHGSLMFSADDGVHGAELWQSYGTADETRMIKDIAAGKESSNPGAFTWANGTIFFQADDDTHGAELWKTNGTAAGTTLVKDIDIGNVGSFPYALTAVGDTLFFTADDGSHGDELWKSDGTTAGTQLIKDIVSGAGSGYPGGLTEMNGKAYFQADDGAHGAELWVSDGTAAGTQMVKDIDPGAGASNPIRLFSFRKELFFTASDGAHGLELWRSDGTKAGTQLVMDIDPGVSGAFPGHYTYSQGTLFFGTEVGVHGGELWAMQINQLPNTPVLKSPSDGAVDVPLTPTFQWAGGDPDGDPLEYLVYLSDDGTSFGIECHVKDVESCKPDPTSLRPNTKYWWQVWVTDHPDPDIFDWIYGSIWSFTTENWKVYLPVTAR